MSTPAEQVRAHAAAIVAALTAPIGVMRQCADRIRQAIDLNFSRGGNAEGAWPPHAPSTVKRYGPHPLLILSGDLRAAATEAGAPGAVEQLQARGLDLSIDLQRIPYARAQNLGFGHIPQREYHLADEATVDDCEDLVSADVGGRL